MNPTKEQVEAVDLSVKGALRVNAYAGTGKTSTLKLIAAEAELRNQRGLYHAFNKSIATGDDLVLRVICSAWPKNYLQNQ